MCSLLLQPTKKVHLVGPIPGWLSPVVPSLLVLALLTPPCLAFGERVPLADAGPPDYAAKYAIIVGINDYSRAQGLGNLQYAANDARDFRRQLVEDFGYDDGRILYLAEANAEAQGVDGPPTFEAIRDAFGKWLPGRGLTADDSVIFFFAGHGLHDAASGAGYLAAADSRVDDKAGTCIPVGWVRERLGDRAAVPCRHRLLLLDCCFSARSSSSTSRWPCGPCRQSPWS